MPDASISDTELANLFGSMYKKKMYKEMVLYMDAS